MMQRKTQVQFIAALSATIPFFITGCHIGWSSPVLKRLLNGEAEPYISSAEASWIVSLFNIAQALSSVPAGYLANVIGRKKTLIICTVPLFLGSWVLVALATTVEMLYAARILAGLGCGVTFTVGPMYLGEIAEDHIRGSLATLFQLTMSLGIMFEYCVGPFASTTLVGVLSAIFPIAFIGIFIWIPESPYYYLLHNRRDEAERSLLWLRYEVDPSRVAVELNKMEKFVQECKMNEGRVLDLIFDKGSRKALFISVSLISFQNFSGIIPLLSYATRIFEESKSSLDADSSVMIVGGVQVVLAVVSSSIVDRAGRRPMMIFSSLGCGTALALEGLFFFMKNNSSDVSSLDWLPVTAMLSYLVFYTVGLGPIPISIQGEIFPTRVKGIAASIGSIFLGLEAAFVTKLYQIIGDGWGMYVVFWIFTGSCLVATLFSILIMPETKGKSLMQINKELSSKQNNNNDNNSNYDNNNPHVSNTNNNYNNDPLWLSQVGPAHVEEGGVRMPVNEITMGGNVVNVCCV